MTATLPPEPKTTIQPKAGDADPDKGDGEESPGDETSVTVPTAKAKDSLKKKKHSAGNAAKAKAKAAAAASAAGILADVATPATDAAATDDRKNSLKPEIQLKLGAKVQLTGLVGKPEYNQTFGIVTGWEEAVSRWRVKCERDGEVL